MCVCGACMCVWCAVAYPGFQREGCLRSGPIQKVGGGRFRSDIRKVGGGGGGGHSALGPIHRKYLHVPT